MRFEELNWMDVESYLRKDDRIMLVLGSCEQHGYLSLQTDMLIPQALADAASQESNILVAPALNFGVSPYFMAFPGTITMRSTTYLAVLEDIFTSLIQHGFRRFLILNGHGGNNLVSTTIEEILNRYPEVKVRWYAWWQAPAVISVYEKHGLKPGHATWMEAFPFTRVTELPSADHSVPEYHGLMRAKELKNIYPEGVMGSPYQADLKIMDEIFQAALANILYSLKFEDE